MAAAETNVMTPLENSNIFFNRLGSIQLGNGYYRFIKTIKLGELHGNIDRALKGIGPIFNCTIPKQDTAANDCQHSYMPLERQLHLLKKEFQLVISSVDSSKISKRGLDFVGSGLKYLFGVMDHDDEKLIRSTMEHLSINQDNLKEMVSDSFEMIRKQNANFEAIAMHETEAWKALRQFKEMMLTNNLNMNEYIYKVHLNQLVMRSQALIQSLEVQVTKLHNAILFAKAGILDPYVINADELIKRLSEEKIGYKVTHKDVDGILRNITFSIVIDQKAKNLYIIIKFPTASRGNFNLFECLLAPKLKDSLIISLVDVPKYFAISKDKTHYIQEERLSCFITEGHIHICQDLVVRNIGHYPSCVANVYVRHTDNECIYKKYLQNFDAHSIIYGGLIAFSSTTLEVVINCGAKVTIKEKFNGTVLIHVPDQSSVTSDKFYYKTGQLVQDVDLGFETPIISCCSPFYELPNLIEPKLINPNRTSFTMKDLNIIDNEVINNDLHKLKNFGKTYFSQVTEETHWRIWLGGILFLTIICLYLLFKFQHLLIFCCVQRRIRRNRAVAIHQQTSNVHFTNSSSMPDHRLKF